MATENTMDVVDRVYIRDASFAHMARMATEAGTEGAAKWIAKYVGLRRRYKPPKEAIKRRTELRHE